MPNKTLAKYAYILLVYRAYHEPAYTHLNQTLDFLLYNGLNQIKWSSFYNRI